MDMPTPRHYVPNTIAKDDGYIAEKVKEMDEMKMMMDHVRHEQIKKDAEFISSLGHEDIAKQLLETI